MISRRREIDCVACDFNFRAYEMEIRIPLCFSHQCPRLFQDVESMAFWVFRQSIHSRWNRLLFENSARSRLGKCHPVPFQLFEYSAALVLALISRPSHESPISGTSSAGTVSIQQHWARAIAAPVSCRHRNSQDSRFPLESIEWDRSRSPLKGSWFRNVSLCYQSRWECIGLILKSNGPRWELSGNDGAIGDVWSFQGIILMPKVAVLLSPGFDSEITDNTFPFQAGPG